MITCSRFCCKWETNFLPCYTVDKIRTEHAAVHYSHSRWIVITSTHAPSRGPQRSTRAIPCILPQANLVKNPAINFTAHGAHYTTYISNAILALGSCSIAPVPSSAALGYTRLRPYSALCVFPLQTQCMTTCPIHLMMIHTSQIPATRRGCRNRHLKISGRRRARRKLAAHGGEIMQVTWPSQCLFGRYCEGIVLRDEGAAGPGQE